MPANHQASAWTRLRGIVAENGALKRQVTVLEERIRRMERVFEEGHQAYVQSRTDLAVSSWPGRRAAEEEFLKFIEAVMPDADAVEAQADAAAAVAHRQRIREFFVRTISHKRRQRDL